MCAAPEAKISPCLQWRAPWRPWGGEAAEQRSEGAGRRGRGTAQAGKGAVKAPLPAKARCGKAAARAQSSEDAGLSFGVRLCGIDQARRTMIDREGATPREYTAEEH